MKSEGYYTRGSTGKLPQVLVIAQQRRENSQIHVTVISPFHFQTSKNSKISPRFFHAASAAVLQVMDLEKEGCFTASFWRKQDWQNSIFRALLIFSRSQGPRRIPYHIESPTKVEDVACRVVPLSSCAPIRPNIFLFHEDNLAHNRKYLASVCVCLLGFPLRSCT